MSFDKMGESKKQKRLHVEMKFRSPCKFPASRCRPLLLRLRRELRLTEQGLSGCRVTGPRLAGITRADQILGDVLSPA